MLPTAFGTTVTGDALPHDPGRERDLRAHPVWQHTRVAAPGRRPTRPGRRRDCLRRRPGHRGRRRLGVDAARRKVVGIDPGHNGDNFTAPAVIDAPVFNGRTTEACDTTGTETDDGYTEASFNFNVALFSLRTSTSEGAHALAQALTTYLVGS